MKAKGRYTITDILMSWPMLDSHALIEPYIGPKNTVVYKMAGNNVVVSNIGTQHSTILKKDVLSTPFWKVWSVHARNLEATLGYIFKANKNAKFKFDVAPYSAVNRVKGVNYANIDSSFISLAWEGKNVRLVKFEDCAEVVTTLYDIMGVSVE